MTNTATIRQINFINSLKADRDISGVEAQTALNVGQELWRRGEFTTKAASAVIDVLKAQPNLSYETRTANLPRVETTEAPEGMHKVGDRIYKVQRAIHGSGNLYAKVLVQDGDDWSFEYAPGVVKTLSEATKMSLEEAKEFGALYGTCCVCGRTLTKEESIEAGIGPVCASKF